MPKNMINLNALPLGDLPDGGLITLPGDKVTIKDRVIIHESVEGGKKVVKLYRQVDGPQTIQQVAAPIQQGQQGVKRSGSPLPAMPEKKKKKKNKGAKQNKPPPTVDQERRRREITMERHQATTELRACATERDALDVLKASDPDYPNIDYLLGANAARKKEADRWSNRVGGLRRALNNELKLKNTVGWETQLPDVGYNEQHPDENLGYFGQPLMQSHTTALVENSSNSNMLIYEKYDSHALGAQDPYRQSYIGEPGYQNHRQSLLQRPEDVPSYFDTSASALPGNKIHPSRLLLMNTTTAMPERQSTEPQVLMKVTGENMVPLAKSRITSRATHPIVKQERELLEMGEILENVQEVPRDRDAHVTSWKSVKREHDQSTWEGSTKLYSSRLLEDASKSDEAIAWLDANIPSRNEWSDGMLGRYHGQFVDLSRQDDAEQGYFGDPNTDSAESNIIKLGLQLYRDEDEGEDEGAQDGQHIHFAEDITQTVPVKRELDGNNPLATYQQVNIIVKDEPIAEHNGISYHYHDATRIMEQPDYKYQVVNRELPDAISATRLDNVRDEDNMMLVEAATEVVEKAMNRTNESSSSKQNENTLLCVGAATEVAEKALGLSDELPSSNRKEEQLLCTGAAVEVAEEPIDLPLELARKQVLGEMSVNIVIRNEEDNEETV
ncbi:hypothetical protein VTL71DRAFT_2415 [Oculimacula yallundae]|uniref:Uncharacterized protein n=1 Tax=Oculimacula yallundae TaxID=86028 RepID=A0ABR4C8Z8_9HELO